ncbi:hypothetical protein E2C01_073339 [Portunus trituberculatus]|uniref:Uncharacterized protein n=1 Tax=Portunus trituberculatus TaxID=210409 RepID=A0A5B7I0G1_PORTR|nr:hypothetical protein [Portunus trituberculatus]
MKLRGGGSRNSFSKVRSVSGKELRGGRDGGRDGDKEGEREGERGGDRDTQP